MSDLMTVDQVLVDLAHIRDDLEMAADALTGAETHLCIDQFYDLAKTKEDYELIVATATMEAYANDIANGRNQKMRDVQLAAWLGQQEDVKNAKHRLRKAELQIMLRESELDVARRNYTVVTNRLWALRAIAELHAARLNAAAGVEYHTERGERAR